MRISMFWVVSCFVASGIAASPAHAQQLVIDDFKDSPYSITLTDHPTWLTDYQSGAGATIVGGVRLTSITVSQATPQFGQSTLLQIQRNGSMVISGGYKSYFGLILGYGYAADGGANRLNVNLSGNASECQACDRFRINFDGSDSELSYVMQVHDSDGNFATYYGVESLAGRNLPFHVDFPFADFGQDSALPVDWNRVDFIVVLLQSGSYLGAHDFAVTGITAIGPPPPEPVE